MDTKTWLNDATDKLCRAQQIGGEADQKLQRLRAVLSLNDEAAMKSNFLLDAINQQLSVLKMIKEGVRAVTDERNVQFGDLEAQLSQAMENIRREYQQLQEIQVDSSLSKGDDRCLFDFVSTEAYDELVGLQKDLSVQKQQFNDEFNDKIKTIEQKTEEFSQLFTDIENQLNQLNEETWVDEYLEEIHTDEQDIAMFIESLANHYDLCKKADDLEQGVIDDLPEVEKKELYQVIEKDYNQSGNIFEDLQQCFIDFEHDFLKIDEYFNNKIKLELDNLELKKLFKLMKSFGNHTLKEISGSITKNENNFISKLKHQIINHCKESAEIISNLESFKKSYFNLISEIKRRESVQIEMKNIIDDTIKNLNYLQMKDFKSQQSFIENNLNNLPVDIYEGFECLFDGKTPLFDVQATFLKLPEVKKR